MGLTWGELKALFLNAADETPIFIEIVVEGGASDVQVRGFVAADTILRKPVERAEQATIS